MKKISKYGEEFLYEKKDGIAIAFFYSRLPTIIRMRDGWGDLDEDIEIESSSINIITKFFRRDK